MPEFVLTHKDRKLINHIQASEYLGSVDPPLTDGDRVQFIPSATTSVAMVLKGGLETRVDRVYIPADDIRYGSFFSTTFGVGIVYGYNIDFEREREFRFLKLNTGWEDIYLENNREEFDARLNLFLLALHQVA